MGRDAGAVPLHRTLERLVPAHCGGCGDRLDPARGRGPGRSALAPAGTGEDRRRLAAMTGWCEHCVVRCGPVPGAWEPRQGGCPGWAAAPYRGPVRRAVLAAKAGAPTASVQLLLASLPDGLVPAGATVTWLPGHPRRTAVRLDAGAELAGAVADHAGARRRILLRRSPLGRRQVGREDDARRAGAGRLGLGVARRPSGPVVLVDDVRTTGASLDHAAALLREAGAGPVTAIVVATRPPRADDAQRSRPAPRRPPSAGA